jgi:hypothetical protein
MVRTPMTRCWTRGVVGWVITTKTTNRRNIVLVRPGRWASSRRNDEETIGKALVKQPRDENSEL